MRVRAIMTTLPLSIAPDASLDEAMQLMDEWAIRHLPVVLDGQCVGVISDRDLLVVTGWLPERMRAMRRDMPADSARLVSDIMHENPTTVGPDDSLVAVAVEQVIQGIGCTPVVEKGRLLGMVSEMDVVKAFAVQCEHRHLPREVDPPVRRLMSREPAWIERDRTLGEARETMARLAIRHLPVLERGELVGLVSDRDVRRALGRGRHASHPLTEVMTYDPVTVDPETPASTAAAKLYHHRFSALPVVEKDALLGIVTVTDMLDHCANVLRAPDEAARD